MVKTFVLSI